MEGNNRHRRSDDSKNKQAETTDEDQYHEGKQDIAQDRSPNVFECPKTHALRNKQTRLIFMSVVKFVVLPEWLTRRRVSLNMAVHR